MVVDKETPIDSLVMDKLETSLDKALGRTFGKENISILKIFIKPRASTMFGHLS